MVKRVRECPTTQLQSEGKDKPEPNVSVPQQEVQPDATEGKDIVDYKPDIDYEGQNLKTSQSLKKKRRRILMQSMQKWSYLYWGPSVRG